MLVTVNNLPNLGNTNRELANDETGRAKSHIPIQTKVRLIANFIDYNFTISFLRISCIVLCSKGSFHSYSTYALPCTVPTNRVRRIATMHTYIRMKALSFVMPFNLTTISMNSFLKDIPFFFSICYASKWTQKARPLKSFSMWEEPKLLLLVQYIQLFLHLFHQHGL